MKGRVNDCTDFVAAETVYHQNCRVLFSSGKPLKSSNSNVGRPANQSVMDAFEKACEWLEKYS